MKLEPSWQIFENIHVSNSVKIHPVGAKLFRVDRQTDRHDKATSNFMQFFKSA